jgi:hypothetical protein
LWGLLVQQYLLVACRLLHRHQLRLLLGLVLVEPACLVAQPCCYAWLQEGARWRA